MAEEIKESLGDRMKRFEKANKTKLNRDEPVIIRLDGQAFHTYTAGFVKPFDEVLIAAMQYTMVRLCEGIMNVRIGYTQSDEITLVLLAGDKQESQLWFDGTADKIITISASMATAFFNEYMDKIKWMPEKMRQDLFPGSKINMKKLAFFDSRAWNVPSHDEAMNCLLWRQRDCIKNSVSSLAQFHFSHRQLHKKNQDDMKNMLVELGHPWDDLPVFKQRGTCSVKKRYIHRAETGDVVERTKWDLDLKIPEFGIDREYISKIFRSPLYNTDSQ